MYNFVYGLYNYVEINDLKACTPNPHLHPYTHSCELGEESQPKGRQPGESAIESSPNSQQIPIHIGITNY